MDDLFSELRGAALLQGEDAFLAQYPGSVLTRAAAQDEPAARAIVLTTHRLPAVRALSAEGFDETTEHHILPNTKPATRFACYRAQKTDRNIFAGGITLGRAQNNDVVVPLSSVSKFHAWLKDERGSLLVFDARSRFGTFVGGVRVPEDGETGLPLHSGDELRLGEVSLTYWDAPQLYRWLRSLR